MKQYWNKLVRDKIPEELSSKGIKLEVRALSDSDYVKALDSKLREEAGEYLADHSLAELADLLEVIYAQAAQHGYTLTELEEARQNKAARKGGFDGKVWLISTEE